MDVPKGHQKQELTGKLSVSPSPCKNKFTSPTFVENCELGTPTPQSLTDRSLKKWWLEDDPFLLRRWLFKGYVKLWEGSIFLLLTFSPWLAILGSYDLTIWGDDTSDHPPWRPRNFISSNFILPIPSHPKTQKNNTKMDGMGITTFQEILLTSWDIQLSFMNRVPQTKSAYSPLSFIFWPLLTMLPMGCISLASRKQKGTIPGQPATWWEHWGIQEKPFGGTFPSFFSHRMSLWKKLCTQISSNLWFMSKNCNLGIVTFAFFWMIVTFLFDACKLCPHFTFGGIFNSNDPCLSLGT